MTLLEIQSALTSTTDWEDSYLKDGSQRLLSDIEKYKAEIVLGEEIISVSFLFDAVDMEIVSVISFISGSTQDSLRFLKDAATFVASNPNIPYQESFEDYFVEMTQIKNQDGLANALKVERVRG